MDENKQPQNKAEGAKAVSQDNNKPAPAKTAKKAGTAVATKRKSKPKKAAKQTANTTAKTAKNMEKTMTQGKNQFDKMTQDAAKTSRAQLDAFIKSGNIAMKGLEDMASLYMGMAQSSAEKNSEAIKSLLACRTINEYAEAQNLWMQQNFDDFMTGTTKLSELSVKIATDAFEPINDQMSKTLKKAADSVAA